jgi:ferric-dicitrate binding protein FerR (iron transport regulator)
MHVLIKMDNRINDRFQHIFEGLPDDCDPNVKDRVRKVVFAALPGRERKVRRFAFAALQVAAAVAAVIAFHKLSKPADFSLERIHALAGQTESVTLPDSSVIWLKGGTDFFYPEAFHGKERKVFLNGEIYAEVSKDSRRPFIIDMDGNSLEVYGTSFNLKAYPESEFIEVSLVSGSVKTIVRTDDGVAHENMLRPGERLRISKDTGEYTFASFNPEYFIPFKDKRVFSFDNLTLSEILSRLEEGFGVDIKLISRPNLSERFFAYFSGGESLDEILGQLSPGLKYKIVER